MKQITLPYGTFYAKESDTHLHGVLIQSLVEHFGATLDTVKFLPGQRVRWSIDGTSVEVEIIKQSTALPGYWLVAGANGLAVLAHEKDMEAVREVTA